MDAKEKGFVGPVVEWTCNQDSKNKVTIQPLIVHSNVLQWHDLFLNHNYVSTSCPNDLHEPNVVIGQ